MNRFSRVRHHVTVEDVKKKHLEKIAVENFKKEEEVIVKEISNRFRRDWKREIFEGMTTANIMTAPLAPAGDEVFNDTPTTSADVFADAPARDPGFQYDAMVGTSIKSSGSGTGNNGGFDIGNHVAFDGSGSGGARWCVLKAVDTTEVDTMVVRAITGNGSNGGQTPDETLEDLILYYKTPEMFDYIPITYFPELTLSAFQGGNDIIIPVGHGLSGLQDYQIKIPSYARGKETRFLLYQVASTASGQDTYGLTNISFRRQTPVNVVVPLDSPEAISFINVGTNEGDPKKRKKKVDDMLSASDEYTTKQMGDQFPGQGGRIDGEDPFKSAPLTPDDVIERSPIGKGEVTKSFADFSTTAAAAQPEAETEAEPTTPSTQTTMNPTDDDGKPIPVTTIDPKTGTVEGSDAADIEETDEDPPSEEELEREKEMETQAEIEKPEEEPEEEPEDEEDLSDEEKEEQEKEKEESKLTKLFNDYKNKAFDILRNLDAFDAPVDLALSSIVAFLGLTKNTIRIGRMFQRTSNILFGTNFGTDEKAYLEGITAVDKWLNDVKIAQSYLTGKIVKHNYGYEQIKSYADNLTPSYFMLLQGDKHYAGAGSAMGISDTRHEYVDDNIYVKNGEVFVNDQNIPPLANMDTRDKGKAKTSLVEEIGKGYGQMIIPKDGSKPYFHFYDYNYLNLNSKDADLVTGSLVGADKEVPSSYQMTFANIAGSLRKILPGRLFDDMVNRLEGNLNTFDSNLRKRVGLDGWPPGIHGATLTDFKIPLESLPEETQEMIANHPLSWTPERVANMSAEDFGEQFYKRSMDKFEFDLAGDGKNFDAYALKAMEDPDSLTDPEFLRNFKRFSIAEYDEETGTHPGAEEGTVQYDYDRAVEELEKISNSPEYSAASDAAIKEYENVNKERDEKYAENEEKFGSKAQSDLYEKLVGPYYRAVQRATRGGGSISKNSPTYQKMIDGKKKYDKQVKVLERKYAQGRNAIRDEYDKLSDEAYARYNDTIQVIRLDDGTFGMVNGGDFKTKGGKVIPGKRTLTAKQQARFDEVRKEYEEVQNYLYSDEANWDDNYVKPYVLYDVKMGWSKYEKTIPSESWTPEKFGSGKRPQDDPTPDPSFTGSAASFVGGDATAAATAAAETKKNKKKNESLEYFANPYGSVTLFEKLKTKGFFNPKDIKPTFPENDPPELDPKTKMHPNYGKQAGRYKRLDPISANAMPPTGDEEIDAVVDKQRTKPRLKTQTTFSRLKKFRKKS